MTDYPARTPEALGAILRGCRREKRLTQEVVGKNAGLLQAAVSQIESRPGSSSLGRIYRVLSALDLELVVRSRRSADPGVEW
jgi:HTH-type transcriptional regulator/antitoxin HipB